MFSALLINEDQALQEDITHMLQGLGVKLTCTDASIEKINKVLSYHLVHVIFLNIDSIAESPLLLVERIRLQYSSVDIVFMKSSPDYAYHAFELHAIDYLVKPFSYERFRECIKKICSIHYPNKENSGDINQLLPVKCDNGIQLLNQEDIAYISSEGRSSKLIINTYPKKSFKVTESLKSIEQRINSAFFIRTHRSYLINLNHVKRIETSGQTNLIFFNLCPDIAYVSKNYIFSLYEKLNLR
ncbi:two-component system response regulator LytT [Paenibacillus sp. SORGH_AS306]|uniref:LytR/AlgR family response regulator transcription factor n=1 Tax=unclassified Paenibacillus TaxID=185978 RepID=UPI0023673604|nr:MULTISPECIES: LytTR family DNA-binding domain-containing protein [unclassified Paenibacillus]MDQ1236178.1 two-component system response regulator LytT [Paenibacillus sp. SORGH_AS_0306]MDR6108533.1 two-component system response regulator LytT [Paenibacillus sp. SORGH_AS_0338]WDF51212.1 LytTR family DNA-binding domain-containing protein [Paenibacillus sp. KACC 21273]